MEQHRAALQAFLKQRHDECKAIETKLTAEIESLREVQKIIRQCSGDPSLKAACEKRLGTYDALFRQISDLESKVSRARFDKTREVLQWLRQVPEVNHELVEMAYNLIV